MDFFFTNGLDLFDYGARHYDAALGRWFTIDILAEKYYSISPYVYCLNNPVRLVDPDGAAPGNSPSPGYYHECANSSRYIEFLIRHPIAAIRIGNGVTPGATNISTNATRFVTRGNVLYGSKKGQEDKGSENGAFRHSLWQASITSEFGSGTAKEAGDAHEVNPFADLTNRSYSNLEDADQTADLLNNQIGRKIGQENEGANMLDLANIILEAFKNTGLYTATQDINGNWTISKTELSWEKYQRLKKIFKNLNLDARTREEQENKDK